MKKSTIRADLDNAVKSVIVGSGACLATKHLTGADVSAFTPTFMVMQYSLNSTVNGSMISLGNKLRTTAVGVAAAAGAFALGAEPYAAGAVGVSAAATVENVWASIKEM